MKLLVLILNFVGAWSWPLITSIVALLNIKINNLKDNFYKLNSNYLSGNKILSKLYSYKYVCKRNYSVLKTNNKNSDFYDNHGYHWTIAEIYKDKSQGYFYIAANLTTNSRYSKVANVGILHEYKPVYLYSKYDIKKLDSASNVKELIEYLKDANINPAYNKKFMNDPSAGTIVENNFEFKLKNNYGCKDLTNITANIMDDENFNKVLFIIEKDLENKKID